MEPGAGAGGGGGGEGRHVGEEVGELTKPPGDPRAESRVSDSTAESPMSLSSVRPDEHVTKLPLPAALAPASPPPPAAAPAKRRLALKPSPVETASSIWPEEKVL